MAASHHVSIWIMSDPLRWTDEAQWGSMTSLEMDAHFLLDIKCLASKIYVESTADTSFFLVQIRVYLSLWNFKYFLCSPRKLGKIPILTFHIFQSGWFSHQLVLYMIWWYNIISIKFRIGIFVTWGPLTWLHLAVFGHPEVRISCFHFGLGGKSHVRIGKLQKTILVFFSVLASTLMFCL